MEARRETRPILETHHLFQTNDWRPDASRKIVKGEREGRNKQIWVLKMELSGKRSRSEIGGCKEEGVGDRWRVGLHRPSVCIYIYDWVPVRSWG